MHADNFALVFANEFCGVDARDRQPIHIQNQLEIFDVHFLHQKLKGKLTVDFLKFKGTFDGDVITNPPYKYAKEFVEKAIESVTDGHKVAMFLKLQFLEGKGRREFFDKYPPKMVYVSSSRIMCAKNGDFDGIKESGGSAVAYCWYIWEKGYSGDTIIKWFN